MIPISKDKLYGLCGTKSSGLYLKATYKCFAGGLKGIAYFKYGEEQDGAFEPELTPEQIDFTTFDDFFILDFNTAEEFHRYLALETMW